MTNEPAERLRDHLAHVNLDLILLLDAALAAERKAIFDRINEILDYHAVPLREKAKAWDRLRAAILVAEGQP